MIQNDDYIVSVLPRSFCDAYEACGYDVCKLLSYFKV